MKKQFLLFALCILFQNPPASADAEPRLPVQQEIVRLKEVVAGLEALIDRQSQLINDQGVG